MRFKRWSALSLALAFGLTACDDSGTGPGDGGPDDAAPFNPSASAADFQVVEAAFDSPVFESLGKSSGLFSQFAGAPALAYSLIDAGWDIVTGGGSWQVQESGQQVVEALYSSSAAVVLIPDDFRGRTYDYDPERGYYYNEQRTGAPQNGMRFILFAINPVTDEPILETEIGYVDILDESTDLSGVARLVVMAGGTEYMNYTVSATTLVGSVTFGIDGFITNGTDQVDLDLTASFATTFASSSGELNYVIAVPSRSFSLIANIVMAFSTETQQGSITVDAQFQERSNTVQVLGSFTGGESDGVGDAPANETGELQVLVNGTLFATIGIQGETITITGPNGEALSADEAQALRNIFDAFENVFDDKFEDFVRPVSWLFNLG